MTLVASLSRFGEVPEPDSGLDVETQHRPLVVARSPRRPVGAAGPDAVADSDDGRSDKRATEQYEPELRSWPMDD